MKRFTSFPKRVGKRLAAVSCYVALRVMLCGVLRLGPPVFNKLSVDNCQYYTKSSSSLTSVARLPFLYQVF